MRMVLDDSELSHRIFSPVCTYCAYWKPTDNRHCDAYPRGNTPKDKTPEIPQPIWDGDPIARSHTVPWGNEAKDAQSNPILFVTHPAVVKLPANIIADLKKRAAQQEKQK